MLCLTDIDQDGDVNSAIYKYQLHSTESPAGAHIFEDLHVGQYYAQLTIIGQDNSINVSELLTVTVYELGAAKIVTVSPRDSSFQITLDPYDGVLQPDQYLTNVSFILFGRKTNASGLLATGPLTTQNLNIVKDYRSDNIYTLNSVDGIQNSWQYEIACFYTDNQNISGDISNTLVETPTNKPNQIKDVEATYDYANKQLIIKYTNPDDISEWTPTNVRARLTYGSTVQDYVFNASSNSGTTIRGEQLVFNENSSPRLTADSEFTLTLIMASSKYDYSVSPSDPIRCIVPSRFCSEPTTISNVQYIVGDDTFNVTYNNPGLLKYYVRVRMVITPHDSTQIIHEVNDYTTGTPLTVVNGNSYKVNLQVFYTDKIDSSIVFGPSSEQTTYFDMTFIPHGQADEPSDLQVVYGDGTATLSWNEPEFHGYILDRYEVSYDNGLTWLNNRLNTSYVASCSLLQRRDAFVYISGDTYNFKVKAVTKSPDASVYNGVERISGQEYQIVVYPLKKPQVPILDSQTPGDSRCDVTFHDGDNFGGARQYYKYTINDSSYNIIYSGSTNTSHIFTGLTNDIESIIRISVVTQSGPVNVQESDQLIVYTKPFIMPVVPTLSAKPYTSSVELTWSPNNPLTILDYPVEYNVAYKLSTDNNSQWITQESVTSPLTISGLTSNLEYNFKILSKIYNFENDVTLPSEYSTLIKSRPFIYRNAPTMKLTPGDRTIKVDITLPVDPSNNLYGPNKYYATVDTDPDVQGSGIILELSSNTSPLIFNIDKGGLINLEKYRVVAWYDMVIDEQYETTTDPYQSNTVSNSATPFNKAIVPVLYSDPDDGKITFSWDDGNMNGLEITGYQVRSKSYTASSWGDWETLTLAQCNQSDSTTQNVHNYEIVRYHPNGTKMSYQISAIVLNAGNTYYSDPSIEAVATPYTQSDAPTLHSYESSSSQITLKWVVPSNLGGLPLLRYEVSMDGANWDYANPLTNTTHIFNTNLVNGRPYTFSVRAVTNNSDNYGQASDIDKVMEIQSNNILNQVARPYDTPSITLESVVHGDGKLTLNWSEPYKGGHENFDRYKVYYNGSFIDNIESEDLNYTIDGLNNGTSYSCAVEIYLEDENDNASTPLVNTRSLFKTNIPYKPAVAPKNVRSVPSNESVRVSWDALTTLEELGGLPLKRYEVKKDNESVWIQSNGDLYHEFEDLNNGEEYTFYVRAVTTNSNYASDPAITTDEVEGATASKNDIPFLPLAAPLIVICEPGNTNALLTWSEPDLVGLTLVRYEVKKTGDLSWTQLNGEYLYYNFNGLNNGNLYTFYVKAIAQHDYITELLDGPSSEISKTPFVKPEKVTNLKCSAVNGDLTITFTQSSTSSVNNDLLAQDYRYILNDGDYNELTSGQKIDISSYGDDPISVHVYSRIINPNNNVSVFSDDNNIDVVNSNLTSNIQNLTATPGNNQIILNWENLGTGTTYYIVRIKDDGSYEYLQTVTTRTATITNLTNGTLYRFNVYAAQDDMLQITSTPIGPPKDLSASNTTVNVNFNGDSKVGITIIGITETDAEVIPTEYYTTTSDRLTTINQLTTKNNKNLDLYLKYVVIASNSVGSTYIVSPP